jgi:hypothetical protein
MSTEENINLEPVYSQHVLELIRMGHEYCLFIEQSDKYSADDVVRFIHKIFPMLYLKGLFLPAIEKDPEASGERYVTEEEWENVFNNLRSTLGEKDTFWMIDPEITGGDEAVKLSLAEILTDIYQDLKDFIMQYQKNSRPAKEIAVHECRQWFFNRWGKRITETSHYLHHTVFKADTSVNYDDLS